MSRKLTPESLWEKIDSLMRSSSTEQIRNPTGQVKKCLEEWLPIYHYCIKRRRLGLSLTVQLDESEEYPDAVVELNGFDSEVINVEVAFVKDYEDALRSELLNDSGWCPGVGPISRDKISGDILAEMHAYSGGSIAAKTYQSIRDRVLKKVEKNYSHSTDLIVGYYCHDAARHKPSEDQLKMIYSCISNPIRSVYLVNLYDNHIIASSII